MTVRTIKARASALYKGMDWQERGEKTIAMITPREGKLYEQLLALTFAVSEQTSLSMDSTYTFTMEALGIIADSTAKTMDELIETENEIEPDIYTGELTAWLAESVNHVQYLSDALSEYEPEDGIQALSIAQQRAKQEVYRIVLEHIQK